MKDIQNKNSVNLNNYLKTNNEINFHRKNLAWAAIYLFSRVMGPTISLCLDKKKATEDMIVLKEKIPQLQNFDELSIKIQQEIEPYYKDYISRFSREVVALSFELSTFIMVLCNIMKPKKILDLGSGFSSFIFRSYMSKANPKPLVWTVDDSPEWLEISKIFININELSTENLSTWQDFIKEDVGTFDLILFDLGSFPFRKKVFREVLKLVSSNGLIVLDDIHNPAYRPYVKRVVNESNFNYYSLKNFTKDKFGRFSLLVSNL
jgi:predicted O-methyltransferase YrrM